MYTKLLPPLNPKACLQSEPYVIYETTELGNRMVETQPSLDKAIKAVQILNSHERNNGRKDKYFLLLT